MHDCDTSWLEGVFARGDRKLGPVLERAYRAGARFDSWEDQLKIDLWEKAFQEEGVLTAPYLGTIPVSARLPWDHIDVGLEEGFLAREYRKALASRLSLPCGKAAGMFVQHTNLADLEADQRKLVCYDCGVACDLSAMRAERRDYLVKLEAKTRRPTPVSPLEAWTIASIHAAPSWASRRERLVATASASRSSGRAPTSHIWICSARSLGRSVGSGCLSSIRRASIRSRTSSLPPRSLSASRAPAR
jgi:hypothetical protein